jgi:hypothetical protein
MLGALNKFLRGRLPSMRFFFQHQSVGANLLTGLQELAARAVAVPTVIELTLQSFDNQTTGLVHSRAGKNGDGVSKLDAFAASLKSVGAHCDYAMLKFCYVDVTDMEQARALYEHYREAMARIREAHPDVRVAHCTVPLRRLPTGAYAVARRLLGDHHPEFARNYAREWFNEQLRAAHGSEPLFDLAAIESTLPDGTRCTQFLDRNRTPGLIPAYTDDGGHLNVAGRAIVATAFLQFYNGLIRA